jgi:hypothetical protein
VTVEEDSKQLNELMARCLTGECSPEEIAQLRLMVSNCPDLKTNYELMNLLFGQNGLDFAPPEKKHFERIRKRLENEGLM